MRPRRGSGVDDDGDDQRAAPVGAVRPGRHGLLDQLLGLLDVDVVLGGLGQHPLDDRDRGVERRLVVLEPDLGTAALMVAVGLVLLFLAGAKWRYIVPTVALGVGQSDSSLTALGSRSAGAT